MGFFGSDSKQKTNIDQEWYQVTSGAQDQGVSLATGRGNINYKNYDPELLDRIYDLAEIQAKQAGHTFDSVLGMSGQLINPDIDTDYDEKLSAFTQLGSSVLVVAGVVTAIWLWRKKR